MGVFILCENSETQISFWNINAGWINTEYRQCNKAREHFNNKKHKLHFICQWNHIRYEWLSSPEFFFKCLIFNEKTKSMNPHFYGSPFLPMWWKNIFYFIIRNVLKLMTYLNKNNVVSQIKIINIILIKFLVIMSRWVSAHFNSQLFYDQMFLNH